MLKTTILAALFALCSSTVSAAAPKVAPVAKPTDQKILLSIELMKLMNIDQSMRSMEGQMRSMMEQQFESYSTCEAAKPVLHEFSTAFTDRMMSFMADDDMKVDMAAVYADVFTLEELQGIVDFYHSPLGKKMIDHMPELMQKSMLITQGRIKAMMPELQSLGEDYGARIRAAAKACPQTAESDESSTE
jgi:uncharacterized protein